MPGPLEGVRIVEITMFQQGPVAGTKLYRTVDIVDGREIVKYTDKKPD